MKGRVKARRETISKTVFLQEIAREVQPELFWPEEAAAILFGRLETARRVVKKAHLRRVMGECGSYSLPPPQFQNQGLEALPIPSHVISRLNRSKIFPSILPPDRPTIAKLSELYDRIRDGYQLGLSRSWLLDLLAGSGLSWATAAVHLEKITRQRLDEVEIAIVEQARRFWLLFAEGAALYAALVKNNEIGVWRGHLAYFDREQLQCLLPGLVLADHFERREFLANYRMAEEASLDLYTMSCRPLCQHPFPAKFNPLIFGRPKPSRIPGKGSGP